MSLPAGTRLGSYEIVSLLGTGGMGEVYRARDTKLGRDVAVKVLREELVSDPERLRRFEQEARSASALNHPNIITIYDVGTSDSGPFIAMELVVGKSLRQLLTESPFANREMLAVGTQIADGLAKAHGAHIVHRDLKPENIMVTEDGFVKIMDFGLAKLLVPTEETGSDAATLAKEGTSPGVVMGTVGYMSPEQASGKTADYRSDQFSFGAILYEMATGQRAFQRETAPETLTAIIREDVETLTTTNPDVPPPFRWIIERCLAKKPEERYTSTQDLARELKSVREHLAEVSSGPSSVSPPRRRMRSWVVGVVVVALAVAGVLAYFASKPREPELVSTRVAVAVFENQTGDPSMDPIGRMAADWISQGLARTGTVDVVPSSTVFSFAKNIEDDTGSLQGDARMRSLARETKAGTVVSGTYYKRGEALQFHAQVMNIEEDKVLAALDPIDGSLNDPMDALEILRQRVMGAIATAFDTTLSSFLAVTEPPPTYEVYQLWMRQLDLFLDYDMRGVIDTANRISELDPSFLPPQLPASFAHWRLGEYAQSEAIAQRLDASRDNLTPYDLAFLDWILLRLEGDPEGEYRAAKRLAEFNQDPIWCHQAGYQAYQLNLLHEALDWLEKVDKESYFAKRFSAYWNILTAFLHRLGEHEEELEMARWGRRHAPRDLARARYELRALVALDRIEEAGQVIAETLTLPEVPSWPPGRVMELAALELRAHGHLDLSRKWVNDAVEWWGTRPAEDMDSESYRFGFARALFLGERWAEAQELFEALATEYSDDVNYQGYLGVIAVKLGQNEDAQRIRDELRQLDRPYLFGRHFYWQACIVAQTGEVEVAVDVLREGLSKGLAYSLNFHSDVNLEPLRDYPPYQDLMKPK